MLNNIVLIGFMGAGKTTIGREVAKLYNSVLIDTDNLIETNYNMSIHEIFARFGGEKFREAEVYVCDWLRLNVNNTVISTGGGMPMYYDLRDIGSVFYLQAPLQELVERVMRDSISKRPMFQRCEPISELFERRIKHYEKMADYTLNAMESTSTISQKIIDYMKGS